MRRQIIIEVFLAVKTFYFICLFVLLFFITSSKAQSSVQCKTSQSRTNYEVEQNLARLGYWIVRVDCVRDDSTRQAIIAFQKVKGLKRTGILNEKSIADLREMPSPPPPRFPGSAHIEIDITRQILLLTNDSGIVVRILPISSGSERKYYDRGKWQTAHTPRGEFTIERKIDGIRRAPLGNLYYPNYFHQGVAIHGSNSVPAYPASHGCVRIPRFADREFSNLVRIGMKVYVYD